MTRFVRLALLVYAAWVAVYVGSLASDWAHAAFARADVRIGAALR